MMRALARLRAPSSAVAIVSLVLLLLVLGSGLWLGLAGATRREAGASSGAKGLAAAADGGARESVVEVQGSEVARGTLVLSVRAVGQAEAWKRAVLGAQLAGRVSQVPVRESDAVGSGGAVLLLDTEEYRLQLADAEAQLRDARAKYAELVLFDERIADAETRAERERIARARSGLDQAEVRVARARLDLDRTRAAAPFSGRVATLRIVPGQLVRAGDELMTLVDLDRIRVEVQVLEGEVSQLAAGRGATVTFAAFPGEEFRGRVESVNPLVDSGTRTARVTIGIPNPGHRILPGMYARVQIEARQLADRLLVPRSAVIERDRRSVVFVYRDRGDSGRTEWRYVTTGLANDSVVEILPGDEGESVKPGEVVITAGHHTLIHDSRVRLREGEPAGESTK